MSMLTSLCGIRCSSLVNPYIIPSIFAWNSLPYLTESATSGSYLAMVSECSNRTVFHALKF